MTHPDPDIVNRCFNRALEIVARQHMSTEALRRLTDDFAAAARELAAPMPGKASNETWKCGLCELVIASIAGRPSPYETPACPSTAVHKFERVRTFRAGFTGEEETPPPTADDARFRDAVWRVVACARALDTSGAGVPTVAALDEALANLDCVQARRRDLERNLENRSMTITDVVEGEERA